ncbi:MAG: hypothetical protein SWO11_19695 [Thermodesulfobacteriota bacterium]|nr:hypothetical protein [Thermodesulfobacteriota bacterium]
MLSENGYVIYEAVNTRETFEVFEREKGDFHLLLSDFVRLKTVSNWLMNFFHIKPAIPILPSSGYTDDKAKTIVIRKKRFCYLTAIFAPLLNE